MIIKCIYYVGVYMLHCPDPSLLASVLHVIIIDMHKLFK